MLQAAATDVSNAFAVPEAFVLLAATLKDSLPGGGCRVSQSPALSPRRLHGRQWRPQLKSVVAADLCADAMTSPTWREVTDEKARAVTNPASEQ
jgi:hypothetical protein